MPRLSAIFIRTALGYLAAGFTFGALMLFNKGVLLGPWVWRLLPLHIECVLVGWTVQLAMGVAFWILPRFGLGPRRGNESLAWVAYGLINAGVLGYSSRQGLYLFKGKFLDYRPDLVIWGFGFNDAGRSPVLGARDVDLIPLEPGGAPAFPAAAWPGVFPGP